MNSERGENVDHEQELKNEVTQLEETIRTKAESIAAAEDRLRAIVDEALAATNGSRRALVTERVELLGELGLARDEGAELQRRRDAAELAIYEYRVTLADAEHRRCLAAAQSVRVEVGDLQDAERRHFNTVRDRSRTGGLSQADLDRRAGEIAVDLARKGAALEVANREEARAKLLRDRAKAQLEDCRRRLRPTPAEAAKHVATPFSLWQGSA